MTDDFDKAVSEAAKKYSASYSRPVFADGYAGSFSDGAHFGKLYAEKAAAGKITELEKQVAFLIDETGRTLMIDIVNRACAHHNYRWPKELTSGVMFFEGERITLEQFIRWARGNKMSNDDFKRDLAVYECSSADAYENRLREVRAAAKEKILFLEDQLFVAQGTQENAEKNLIHTEFEVEKLREQLEAARAEIEKLKAENLIVYKVARENEAYSISNEILKNESVYLRADLATCISEMKHAMNYYKSCGEESSPEFQIYQSFREALAKIQKEKP